MKKILCVILAAVMLGCAAACTGNEAQTETDTTAPVAAEATETAADSETQAVTTAEVTVPEYEDIGLTSYLYGVDERKSFHYDFAEYKYSARSTPIL